MSVKIKIVKNLHWLAHFTRGGGQDVMAPTRELAVKKGEAAARRVYTTLADLWAEFWAWRGARSCNRGTGYPMVWVVP
jgi:hypothetical protein